MLSGRKKDIQQAKLVSWRNHQQVALMLKRLYWLHQWTVDNLFYVQRTDPVSWAGIDIYTYIIKGPLTRKSFILVNEAVPWVKTNGDTNSCYTYVQMGKNQQLPVTVLSKVSHFHDDVTRGTVRRVNVLQMRIAAIFVLYSGSETLAYRR